MAVTFNQTSYTLAFLTRYTQFNGKTLSKLLGYLHAVFHGCILNRYKWTHIHCPHPRMLTCWQYFKCEKFDNSTITVITSDKTYSQTMQPSVHCNSHPREVILLIKSTKYSFTAKLYQQITWIHNMCGGSLNECERQTDSGNLHLRYWRLRENRQRHQSKHASLIHVYISHCFSNVSTLNSHEERKQINNYYYRNYTQSVCYIPHSQAIPIRSSYECPGCCRKMYGLEPIHTLLASNAGTYIICLWWWSKVTYTALWAHRGAYISHILHKEKWRKDWEKMKLN